MANRRFAPVRQKRPTFWEGVIINQSVTTGASATSTVVTEALLENVPRSTIVRIRGSVLVMLNSSAASPGASVLVMGIKLVSVAALAGASNPVPFTDVGSDWIWWTAVNINLAAGGSAGSPNVDGSTVTERVIIDSKAMRKVGINEVLVFVSQNVVVTSTQTVDVDANMRVLFKR